MSYTLNFPVNAGDPSPLNRIADAVRQVADKTKLSSGEMKMWTDYVRKGVEEGFNLNRVLSQAEQAFGKASGGLSKFTTILRDNIREQEKAERQAQQTERAFARMTTYFSTGQLGVGGALPFGARGGIASMLPGGMAGIGIAGGVGGLLLAANQIRSLTSEAANYGREITNLSLKTGLTIQESQLFSRTAEVTGQNVNMLVTQVRMLSKALAENSDEGRKAKQALREFLPEQTVNALPFMAPGQAIQTVYGGLGGVQNPISQRRIASTILGRQGLEALPFANELGRGGTEIRAAGGVFSDEDIRRAADYKRETELLSIQYEALKTQLGISLIPAVSAVVSALSRIGGGVSGGTPHFSGTSDAMSGAFALLFGGPAGAGLGVRDLKNVLTGGSTNAEFAEAGRFYRALNPAMRVPGAPSAEALRLTSEQYNAAQIRAYRPIGATEREGLEYRLGQARGEFATAAEKNDYNALVAADKKVAAIKEQIKALENYETTAKRIVALEAAVDLKRFQGPFGSIAAARVDALRDVRNQGQRGTINAIFGREIVEQAQEEFKKRGLEAYKGEELSGRREEKYGAREFSQDLKEQISSGEEIRKINEAQTRSAIERQSGRQDRIASLTLDNQPGAAAIASYNARIALAKQLEAIDLSHLSEAGDKYKQLVEFSRIEGKYREDGAKAQLDLEIKLLEIRQKERKEIESLASGAFQAAVTGGGRGFGQFVRGQAVGLGSKVVGNVAGEMFGGIGKQFHLTGDPNSFLGKAFAGTPFGADPTSNLKISTDLNTTATALNTQVMAAVAQGLGVDVAGVAGGDIMSLPISSSGTSGIAALMGLGGGSASSSAIPGLSGIGKTISGFGSNFGLGATNPLATLFGGSIQTGPGTATTGAGLGTAGTIGALAGIAGAGFGVFQGTQSISKGGARGIVGGIGEISGSIAAIDPEPISKAVLAGIAVGAGIISAVLGDPKAARAKQEGRRLLSDQYYAPTPINTFMDTGGSAAGYDIHGNVRTAAGVSPYPQIQEPYYDFRHHVLVPGRSLGLGAPGPGAPVTIVNISAMDAQSFSDFSKRNAHGVMDGWMHAVQVLGRHDAVEIMRPQMG